MSDNNDDITITLHDPSTGRSESMPVPKSLSIHRVVDLGKALLGLEGDIVVTKYGTLLGASNITLQQAGVVNGDLLNFLKRKPRPSPARAAPTAAAGGGGLDFSSLLDASSSSASAPAAAAAGSNLLDFGNLLAANNNTTPQLRYFPGMSFEEALEQNPHPKAIVTLLEKHSHLFKEFNYHMPLLARQIQSATSFDQRVELWRKEMVTNSIRSAAATSNVFHKEQKFRQRLQQNPHDPEAKAYFDQKQAKSLVNEQYMQAMQEYPESMGRVLMLYINAKINSHPLQAFVDSGAQMTIMSKSCAQKCGIFHLLDTRFHGMAVGVGTGKILGRIHIVQLQIGDYHFPCSITIMDDATLPRGGGQKEENSDTAAKPKDMDLLLGLDMLKRFNCTIDLLEGCLKFKLGGSTLETPFLHEKDLDETKGGTKGFDAQKANQELEDAQRKHREAQENQKKKSSNTTNDDDDDAMKD